MTGNLITRITKYTNGSYLKREVSWNSLSAELVKKIISKFDELNNEDEPS